MVTYLLIIMVTILALTYMTYRCFPLVSYGLSPKILALCGITAFILGLLATQIVIYIHHVGMLLGVLLVMLIVSSSILVLTNGVSAEGAVDHQAIISTPNNFSNSVPDLETIHAEGLAAITTEHVDTVLEASIDEVSGEDIDTGLEVNAVSVIEINIDAELEVNMGTELEKTADISVEENIDAELDKLADIDADFEYYLDAGFKAKENCNYKEAILAFEKAIDLEPDNMTALFVITEISALLKLLGFYDEAINQMERGRSLALHFEEQGMVNQFVEGIAYLRILRNALMAAGVFFTPYQALSEEIKGAVDDEFRQWKLNS